MNFPLCALLLSWCGHSWHSCHIPISEFNILLNGRSCKIETTAGENWTKNPALLTLEKTLVLKFHDLISKTGYDKRVLKFNSHYTKTVLIFLYTLRNKCFDFWKRSIRKHFFANTDVTLMPPSNRGPEF